MGLTRDRARAWPSCPCPPRRRVATPHPAAAPRGSCVPARSLNTPAFFSRLTLCCHSVSAALCIFLISRALELYSARSARVSTCVGGVGRKGEQRGGGGSAFAFGRAAHLVVLRHHLDLQLGPRALRNYGRRPALLAAKSALQLELRRLKLDAHLVRVRALCAQLLGELPNAPLSRHARRGDRRADPLGHWRSEPARAEQRELGHGGL